MSVAISHIRIEGDLDGIENMRLDAELMTALDRGAPFAGRVYGWDGPWISLGKSQNPRRALLPGCPVPWAQRPTGGKAVLHGHDVTLGLAVALSQLGSPDARSIEKVYRRLARPLVAALRACGVRASLGADTGFVRSAGTVADCFAHVSPNDIVDERSGAKVCGCALYVSERAVLTQCSIPVRAPLVDPATVFERPGAVAWSSGLDAVDFARELEGQLRCLGD